jgi:hypothetical protein
VSRTRFEMLLKIGFEKNAMTGGCEPLEDEE